MATKDDRPGLLSKVAMFVRNPTKDWSELDQVGDADGNGFDKQALKAMIERKRQNDFVRKREFDQLRKLRDRDPGTIANLARQSFFQNSLPTDIGGRAVTLKKIDEIEAQMSRQWWKSKNGTLSQTPATHPGAATLPPGEAPLSEVQPSDSDLSAPFAMTQPVDFGRNVVEDSDEFIPTQMASDIHSVPGHDMLSEIPSSRTSGEGSFSTSRLFAIEADALETDPELEEAAIRFANSDDAGAEKSLQDALQGQSVNPQLAQAWVGALLDLYRATHNVVGFATAVQKFSAVLEGVKPTWYVLGDAGAEASAHAATPIWESPVLLNAEGMERLRAAMVSEPMPWLLDWSALDHIAPDAVALLDALFGSLCEETVSLRFAGDDRLVRCLRTLTPSGNREVAQSCWHVRLNALRVMGLQDDFELAALDFCVTYGVAPPAWQEARCQFEGHVDVASGAGDDPLRTRPTGLRGTSPHQGPALQGHIVGDAALALSALNTASAGQATVISCRDLVRVDFAAAGSILNWVVMREAEGSQVQFEDVHRLVAAFFNVIGINEHAKVILRAV